MIGKLIQKEILWSTLIQLLGKGAQIGLGLLAMRMVTQALGTENYGLYGKITEFSLFFSTAANLGIFGNMVRKMVDAPDDSNLFWNALLLRLSTAFFFFGIGLAFALTTINDGAFLVGTLIFMSSLLFDYLTSVCDSALQAQYRMGRATLALVAGRVLNFLMVFLLFHEGVEQTGLYLLGPLCASLVTAGLSLIFVRQKIKLSGHWNGRLQKEILWTSLPFGIINLLNSIYYRFLPSALLAKVLSNDLYSTYNLELHLTSVLSLISTFFMFSLLPAFKHALSEGHKQTAKELYKKARTGLGVLSILVVLGGGLFGPWMLSLMSGRDFLAPELWYILPLLLLLTGTSYFYDLGFITVFGLGKENWWLKRELGALLLALSISALGFLPMATAHQVTVILCAAIAAETTMAFVGLKKARQELHA